MAWNIVAAVTYLALMVGAPVVILQLDKPNALQGFSRAFTLELSRDIDPRREDKG